MKSINVTKHSWFSWGLLPMALVANSLLAGLPAIADDGRGCPDGPAISLAKWDELYWRWTYGNTNIPPDANGNAKVRGV